jgi:hypothetical protein
MLFRIMIIGEDGTEFCYDDRIPERDIEGKLMNACESYPEARDISVEKMVPYYEG